jgi:hypothetical protein
MQRSPVEHVDLPLLGVGRDEALAEAELAAELDALRLLRQHRVGAGFEQEAALRLGPDHAAEAVARLEEQVGPAALVERERRGQTADATADHGDRRFRHARPCYRAD